MSVTQGGVIAEVGLYSCHRSVFSTGCAQNTSNGKTLTALSLCYQTAPNGSLICQFPCVKSPLCCVNETTDDWDGGKTSETLQVCVQMETLAVNLDEVSVMSSDGSSRSVNDVGVRCSTSSYCTCLYCTVVLLALEAC